VSEPRLISPMLDDFDMGGPISDHDGVRCCPAMRKDSNDKYIVKIISVPASQTKLDALLLTGAYPDKNSALLYFKELADGIIEEKKILDSLAQMEGFIPFTDCQIVPMDDATGYDVYLLSEYRLSLERDNLKKPMTQLAAVNLGLDLCAALSCCRRSGYMFVDLKPSNIYVTGDKEYRIGDLGFVRLNSLKYESLPDKYRSCYTAPEAEDSFAPLNDTMDVYSAGLVLYQAFNGGALPFSGNQAPAEKFNAPAYADDEMSAIILKACDPDPSERWADPVQMGQAIVSYMQKNGVNDTPLVPQAPETDETELNTQQEALDQLSEDDAQSDISDILEIVSALEEEKAEEIQNLESDGEQTEVAEEALEIPETDEIVVAAEDAIEDIATGTADEMDEDIVSNDEDVSLDDQAPADAENNAEAEEIEQEAYNGDQDLQSDEVIDALVIESDVETELPEAADDEIDEISAILSQVDELVAHQIPDPVVAPEPVEIKLPETIAEDEASDTESEETEDEELPDESEDEEIPEEEKPYVPKKKRKGLVWLIVLLILAMIAAGGYYFYNEYYLQEVTALDFTGSEDVLRVQVSSSVDETLLTVVCADSHGNKVSAPVVGGTAVFSGLTSDTAYTVTVEVDGLHKLTGTTSKVYSTPIQTKIAQMSVVTGSESGSVILSFAVEGPDSDQWNVIYNTEGEAERVTTFPAHMVTLTGLTVGKEYTFRLEPVDDVYLNGEAETTYLVKNLICAENLHISACADGILTAEWNTPVGETVTEWSVRCYSDTGYDETLVTSENSATFANLDDSASYAVEVTAADMSVNQRVQVSANSITLSDFTVDASNAAKLTLKWKANRDIPAAGWSIRYSVNGVAAPSAITSKKNTVNIPAVPNGNYVFTILDGEGNAVLGGPFTYTQEAAPAFSAYGLKQNNISMRLCKTPASSSWSYKDLAAEDYVNSFSAGQSISMVLSTEKAPISSDNDVAITYVIYGENDNLVSYSHDSQIWQSMWYKNYCELDIAGVPADVGTYKVVLLIDGAEVGSQKFEITV